MATKTETTEPGADATASGNMTLAQLGERMTKGRKAASAPNTATATAETATPETSSEQADTGEAQTDLSHSETEDSAALAAEAGAETANGGPDGEADTVNSERDAEGAAASEGEEEGEQAPPKAVRDLQKRVGKVTEQRNELREENAELKAKLAEFEKNAPAPKVEHIADGTFDTDRVVLETTESLVGVRAFLKWADTNPNGGSFTEDGKTYELSQEDVQNYRRQCQEEQTRLHTKRETRLERLRADFDARRETHQKEAFKLYPWLQNKTSPEFQEALAVIRENPGVLKRADFELVVARQVVGQRLEREALKKPAAKPGSKPGTQRPVTPVVTFSPTAARKGADGEKAATVSAAEKQFREGGGKETDLSKLLAQRRLARQEAAKA